MTKKNFGICEVYIDNNLKTTAKVNFVNGEIIFNTKNRIFPHANQNLEILIVQPVLVTQYMSINGIGGRFFVSDYKNMPIFKEHYLSNKLHKDMQANPITKRRLKL